MSKKGHEAKGQVTPAANILSATIPAGQVLSGSMGVSSTPVVITIPPNWDPNVRMTFQVSLNGGANWFDVYHPDGTEYVAVVVPGTAMIFAQQLSWANMVRLRSGSGKAPIPQAADLNFQLLLYP